MNEPSLLPDNLEVEKKQPDGPTAGPTNSSLDPGIALSGIVLTLAVDASVSFPHRIASITRQRVDAACLCATVTHRVADNKSHRAWS